MASKELAEVIDAEIALPALTDISTLSFDDLARLVGEDVFYIPSLDLVKKWELLGLPLIITTITYQYPSVMGDFISCEATIGNATILQREIDAERIPNWRVRDEEGRPVAIKSIDELTVEPDQRIVFNDGSTGVRRQVTKLLHDNGLIQVVDGDVASQDSHIFDNLWTSWHNKGSQLTQVGEREVPCFTRSPQGNQFAIVVARGLRASEYTIPDTGGKDRAVTYYLS